MLIYLAQLTHEKNNIAQNRCYPLAIGYIAEYLKKFFGEAITVEVFKLPTDLNNALSNKQPDILVFSNYLWNTKLSCYFAKKVREKYPNTLIIMGGPNISLDIKNQESFLKQNPAIDIYVIGEGEFVSKILVEKFIQTKNRHEVKKMNIFSTVSIVDGKIKSCNIAKENRIGLRDDSKSLDEIPSPYLSGLFDKFFLDYWVPLIETNRGCPFGCSFCQQGNKYFSKIVYFSIDRIQNEIMYIGKKINEENINAYSIEIADPNYAMYHRDIDISKAIRKTQDKYNFPKFVGCSTGKNKVDLIIENTHILQEGTIMLRNAIQSMNEETLKAINRSSIRIDGYRKIREDLIARGLKNNADLMLGLPEETLESHFESIFDLINYIDEFSCLQTIILNGTEMEQEEFRGKYGITTSFRVIPESYGEYEILGERIPIHEIEEIVIQTNTMSFSDYLQCRRLHLLVMIFHNTELLSPIYTFLDIFHLKKSDLMKELYRVEDVEFNTILNNFLDDTKNELIDADKEISGSDFDNLTYNKIYKHLSIAFFYHKELILKSLSSVLEKLIGLKYRNPISELLRVLDSMMITPFKDIEPSNVMLQDKMLIDIFGPCIEIYPSENQNAALKLLNNIYTQPDDKVNKMVYHLRPSNLCLKLRYQKQTR